MGKTPKSNSTTVSGSKVQQHKEHITAPTEKNSCLLIYFTSMMLENFKQKNPR